MMRRNGACALAVLTILTACSGKKRPFADGPLGIGESANLEEGVAEETDPGSGNVNEASVVARPSEEGLPTLEAVAPVNAVSGDANASCEDDSESCISSADTGGPICPGCNINGVCFGSGEANADNRCEVCDPNRNGAGWSANDGAACDDGFFCTVDDVCTGGVCSGAQRQCDDGVVCNGVSVCVEAESACSADQNQCDGFELCDVESGECVSTCDGCVVDGVCLPSGAAAASNPCLACNPEVSTTSLTVAQGRACGEGATECSGQDTCNATGQCVPNHSAAGTLCGFIQGAAQCDSADSCDGNGQCVLRVAQNGSPCDDGQFCTDGDRCQGGQCVSGGQRNCGASQSCNETADQCICNGCSIGGNCVAAGTINPANACQVCNPTQNRSGFVANNGAACDDGQFCTVTDQCQGGQCVSNARRDCGVGRSCNETVNACQLILLEPGSPCDDGDQCTTGVCQDFFVDSDGDGFAPANSLSNPSGFCSGSVKPGFTTRRPANQPSIDCLDSDNRAKPDQLSFIAVTVPGLNPPFDWNCDGRATDQLLGADAQGGGFTCEVTYPNCSGFLWGTDPVCGQTTVAFTCAIQADGRCDLNNDGAGNLIRTNLTTRCR
jgi:hypothetical protein